MIDSLGIKIKKLKVISLEDGDVLRGLKSTEREFSSFGEVYFSCIKKNTIKAWKKHKEMTLNFIVPYGEVKFVIFKEPFDKNFSEYTISRNNFCRLTIPPNLWVGFQGKSFNESIICNIANLIHDPEEIDRLDLKAIKYNWKND
jgi:dTDP-4-dehydrorhamnose 3,5-epimerase